MCLLPLQIASNVRGSAKDTADSAKESASRAQDKVTGEPCVLLVIWQHLLPELTTCSVTWPVPAQHMILIAQCSKAVSCSSLKLAVHDKHVGVSLAC